MLSFSECGPGDDAKIFTNDKAQLANAVSGDVSHGPHPMLETLAHAILGSLQPAPTTRESRQLVLAVLSEDGLDAPAFGRAEPSTKSSHGGWHSIDFSEQSDLSAALSGASLGPAHVRACPAIREVEDIMVALEDTGGVAVVGPSGSGKSMAAWHAAFRLHESGWRVYVLAQPLSSSGLPDPNSQALLVVDDAQAFAAPPIASTASTTPEPLGSLAADTLVSTGIIEWP